MNSPGRWVPNMLLEKSREITPKKMDIEKQRENVFKVVRKKLKNLEN